MLVIVYHDTKDEEGKRFMEEEVKKRLGNIKLVPISELSNLSFKKGEKVVSLIPFRGGHNRSICEASSRYRVKCLKVPIELIAESIKQEVKRRRCKSVCLMYRRAKRFAEEQEEDIKYIVDSIARSTNAKVSLKCNSCYDCIFSLTMLKGELSKKALEKGAGCGHSTVIEDLFPIAKDGIIGWIESIEKNGAGGGV
ncbi:MAG: hypothetical protein F7B61_02175 [Caldisphaeraceae archaeon]|nr:hypothetical protein [Caldisphaeraceae archaeon]